MTGVTIHWQCVGIERGSMAKKQFTKLKRFKNGYENSIAILLNSDQTDHGVPSHPSLHLQNKRQEKAAVPGTEWNRRTHRGFSIRTLRQIRSQEKHTALRARTTEEQDTEPSQKRQRLVE